MKMRVKCNSNPSMQSRVHMSADELAWRRGSVAMFGSRFDSYDARDDRGRRRHGVE